jgi:hypothetical protein
MEFFFHTSTFICSGYPCSFPVAKQSGHEADHLPPSSVEVKYVLTCSSALPIRHHGSDNFVVPGKRYKHAYAH